MPPEFRDHAPDLRPSSPQFAAARDALDRTLRLMRDDLHGDVSDNRLLRALMDVQVLIVADRETLRSPAAQTALVSVTLLLARSGISVSLDVPDLPIPSLQPPLLGGELIGALALAADSLIPGVRCRRVSTVNVAPDVVIVLGSRSAPTRAGALELRMSASATSGRIDTTVAYRLTTDSPSANPSWSPTLVSPFGALVSAGLAATEVHKLVMRSLRDVAVSPTIFNELFAISASAEVKLDPSGDVDSADLARPLNLGRVDAISGGAITHAALYALARLPGVQGHVRVIEPDVAEVSNLNRYALLMRGHLGMLKAVALSEIPLGALTIEPVILRYDRMTPVALNGLADAVLVGVDHIPSRWAVQKARPQWLGIGATSHYAAMSSEHQRGVACARCLHPSDAPDLGPIPTIAFVSHWAGVQLAWRLVRHRLGVPLRVSTQYDFFTSLRSDLPAALWRAPVAPRPDCRWCASLRRGAA